MQAGPDAKYAVPALVAALKDSQGAVRVAAVDALGEMGPDAKEAAPHLTRLFHDPSSAVREAARQALVRVGRGTDFGPVPNATARQRDTALQRWRDWLAQQERPSPTAEAARLRTEADK
jgi:HEAT repeat protein